MVEAALLTREKIDVSLLEYYVLNSARDGPAEQLNEPAKKKRRSKKNAEYRGNTAFLAGFFDEKLTLGYRPTSEDISIYIYGKAIRTALLMTGQNEFKQTIIEGADLDEKIMGYIKGEGFAETNRIYDHGLLNIGAKLHDEILSKNISIYKGA